MGLPFCGVGLVLLDNENAELFRAQGVSIFRSDALFPGFA
jgi:hypothetical protein